MKQQRNSHGETLGRQDELRETYRGLAGGPQESAEFCMAAGPPGAAEAPLQAGLGCGDPLAFANLKEGETVLDLGCGTGGACFRASRQVGVSGTVYGVDMTEEMIEVATQRGKAQGLSNVTLHLGVIEDLPYEDDSVDVILSNCVINLCEDRDAVFKEAFRVLRPGGRLAICDVLLDGPVPEAVRVQLGESAIGLVEEDEYLAAIATAGFSNVSIVRGYPTSPGEEVKPDAGNMPDGARRAAVVRVAETGEEHRVYLPDEGAMGRSFSGSVTATKCAGRNPLPNHR